ncbi:hypothetical protein SAMN05216389_101175 [Oceanobacillus limi]|uniref:DUF3139 domain-containing protein n=1 Tax=Oceanobacillus limi TaxID=930131 RepID=A0A1H9Y3T2_9BACI|nr:hypothetical protein [Oceanobacillus limi]SES63499.1 hypothetical protein SAMN05216389_101175 [Oceanobacillus limi]
MDKKTGIEVIVLVVVLAALVLYGVNDSKSQEKKKRNLREDTYAYILENGYDQAEIKEVYVTDFSEQIENEEIDQHLAIVVLEDETKEYPIYTYRKNSNELIEFDIENNEIIELSE